MEYIISIFWFSLELIYSYLFWGAFFPKKATKRQSIIVFFFLLAITATYTNIGLIPILKIFLSLLLFLAAISLLYDGSWFRRIFVVLLACIVNGIIDSAITYGFSTFLGLSLNEFVWRKVFYVTTVTIGKLLSVFLAWLLNRYHLFQDFQAIDKKWLLLSLFFPVISFAMLIAVFDNYRSSSDLSNKALLFSAFLALANIAIIYLINIMEKSTKNAHEAALMQQQMEIQTDSILALEKSYRSQRKATHDFRNQLQTIHDLLTNGQHNEALEYVRQLQGMQTTRVLAINSHHAIIDAVLNHKYQSAKDQGIDVQIQVNDLSVVTLNTDTLVVLLTNLLDNAIEACNRLDTNRVIQCRFFATDTIYLSVRNTSMPVVITDNHIPSSKEPRDEHGYGLARVQHVLKQLNAEFTFTFENGWFEFVAEIPHI